jgi:hypothetical protein
MMRRLPYRSPRRPLIGVATAAASRVAVTTQVAFERVVSSSSGSSPISGTTSVCMTAATTPAKASTATTALVRTAGPGSFGIGGVAPSGCAEEGESVTKPWENVIAG